MPLYDYKFQTTGGKVISGRQTAKSIEALRGRVARTEKVVEWLPVKEVSPAKPQTKAKSNPKVKVAGDQLSATATEPLVAVPANWEKWCSTGVHGKGGRKRKALLRCLDGNVVRGHFSDLPLDPSLEPSASMYPSFEHLVSPKDHDAAVVEARIVNDMKSHLSESEFWQLIEHLFGVGVKKGRIVAPFGKRLPLKWSPVRHYGATPSKP